MDQNNMYVMINSQQELTPLSYLCYKWTTYQTIVPIERSVGRKDVSNGGAPFFAVPRCLDDVHEHMPTCTIKIEKNWTWLDHIAVPFMPVANHIICTSGAQIWWSELLILCGLSFIFMCNCAFARQQLNSWGH